MWNNLKRDQIQFLLIDFQEKFFPIMDAKIVRQVKNNILMMLRMFGELNVPMTGTDHYRKGLGPTDADVLREWRGEAISDKKTFSCLGDDVCLSRLEKHGRKVVVLSGLETHICVLQTMLALKAKGYEVVVVGDACLSSTKFKWQDGLRMMGEAGALVVNTEALLFYLLQRVDIPEFKLLVKLLKENQAPIEGR